MLRSPRDSSGFLEDVLRISSGVPEDLQKISKDCLKDSFRFPQDFLKVSAPCEGLAFDRGINPTGPLDQSRGLCASWSRGLRVGCIPLPFAGFPGRVSHAPRRARAAAVVVAAHVPRGFIPLISRLGGPGAAVEMPCTSYAAGASSRPSPSVRRARSRAYLRGPAW